MSIFYYLVYTDTRRFLYHNARCDHTAVSGKTCWQTKLSLFKALFVCCLTYEERIIGFAGIPVNRRGTEYTCDENALHRAYRAKVTKPYEWLQAKK
jgi:hypothetical protein